MMHAFRFSRFRFTLRALDEICLPAYKGSAFRGGFGYVFKKVACLQRNTACDECLLKSTCVYSYVFETPPPKDSEMLRLYPRVPHPFVIEPPLEERQTYPPDSEIVFHLVLIGKAIDYLPYFIYTFVELGKVGIGRKRARYELTRVEGLDEEGKPILIYTHESQTILANPPIINFRLDFRNVALELAPTLGENVAWELASHGINSENVASGLAPTLGLRFLTPTRIRYDGSLTDQLPFHILLRNLLRRISALSYFHCGERLDWDFKGLIDRAKEVETVSSDLSWSDWERYSTRQATRMKLGGVVGTVCYKFPTRGLTEFFPIIRLGQHIHAGKGTSFGLGWYEVVKEGLK